MNITITMTTNLFSCVGCEAWQVVAAASCSGLVLFAKVYGSRLKHALMPKSDKCGCEGCGPGNDDPANTKDKEPA